MTASVLSETPLAGLPSASGVEIIGRTAYVIGDDAAFLYQLDANTLVEEGRVRLFASEHDALARIPKLAKPDLECMTALRWPDGHAGLLLLGSGSRPNRARGWFVSTEHAGPPQELDLTALYAALQPLLPSGVVLNLEAAAATPAELFLLQRTVGRADAALLFRLPLAQVLALLAGATATVPEATAVLFQLPVIAGRAAGFSGATVAGEQLLVTASVEDTDDAVLDGAVLGSFVGVLDLARQSATFAPLTWANGQPYGGKVEGVAVRRTMAAGYDLLLVTDDDAGSSTALLAEVRN